VTVLVALALVLMFAAWLARLVERNLREERDLVPALVALTAVLGAVASLVLAASRGQGP
jgi:uncharacterized membrane protein